MSVILGKLLCPYPLFLVKQWYAPSCAADALAKRDGSCFVTAVHPQVRRESCSLSTGGKGDGKCVAWFVAGRLLHLQRSLVLQSDGYKASLDEYRGRYQTLHNWVNVRPNDAFSLRVLQATQMSQWHT
jgi:hypothetical protein